MRYYNPQFQQPISMFVPDQTPWEMMFKNLDRKEADWAKGEAMPGELDVITSALKTAPGHEDWREELVNNTKTQLNQAIEDAKGNYSDPTFQRKAKNIITSFASNKDVLELQRSREYYDKYIAPQLADPKNAQSIIDTPGYNPFTHEFTGQHRQAYTTPKILTDPNTMEAFDKQLSLMRPDESEFKTGHAIPDGVDAEGNQLYKWKEDSVADKQYKQSKLDKTAKDFASVLAGSDNEHSMYWRRKAAAQGYDVSTPDKLRDYFYDSYKGLTGKWVSRDYKEVHEDKPLGGYDGRSGRKGGSGTTDPITTSVKPSEQMNVVRDKFVTHDGTEFNTIDVFDSDIKFYEEEAKKIRNAGIEDLEKNRGIKILKTSSGLPAYATDPYTGELSMQLDKSAYPNATEAELKSMQNSINAEDTKVRLINAKREALEGVKINSMVDADLNPNDTIENQVDKNILSEAQKAYLTTKNNYAPHIADTKRTIAKLLADDPNTDVSGYEKVLQDIENEAKNDYYDIIKKDKKAKKYFDSLHDYLNNEKITAARAFDLNSAKDQTVDGQKLDVESLKSLLLNAFTTDNTEQIIDPQNRSRVFKDDDERNAWFSNADNLKNPSFYTMYDPNLKTWVGIMTVGGKTMQLADPDKVSGLGLAGKAILGQNYTEQADEQAFFRDLSDHNGISATLGGKDQIPVKTAQQNYTISGSTINQGDYMFKLPETGNVIFHTDDYMTMLRFNTALNNAKTDGERNALIKLLSDGSMGIQNIMDPGLTKRYFTNYKNKELPIGIVKNPPTQKPKSSLTPTSPK